MHLISFDIRVMLISRYSVLNHEIRKINVSRKFHLIRYIISEHISGMWFEEE